jgi:hypothetical protein
MITTRCSTRTSDGRIGTGMSYSTTTAPSRRGRLAVLVDFSDRPEQPFVFCGTGDLAMAGIRKSAAAS